MARRAIVHDAGMIEGCREKETSVMTDTTILIRQNMINVFGCGESGIMT